MPRPDVSAARRPQILQAASEVFLRKGLDAARMEEIAQEAGLSIGGIYWYFKSKDEVIYALLESIVEPDLTVLRELLAQPGTVRSRLAAYVGAATPLATTQLPLTYELLTMAGRSPAARAHLATYISTYHATFAQLLRQGIDRGEFVACDVDAMATAMLALLLGLSELAYLVPGPLAGETATLETLDHLLAGITRQEAAPAAVRYTGKWSTRTP